MKILVFLGNPGKEYEGTRHNVGFDLVDQMVHSGWMKGSGGLLLYSWLNPNIELVKPQTFMNKSGEAVKYVVKKHSLKTTDLFVIHDDLDIRLGNYKIQLGKGPKVHNGLGSITECLGTDQFWRVRVGIENRASENKIPGKAYVLQRFNLDEKEKLKMVFNKIIADFEGSIFV